jgi:hypothetical protein
MNIRIQLNNQTISEGSDTYGAGAAFPTRGSKFVADEVTIAVARLISPASEDGDEAQEKAGAITVRVETPGDWPEVTEWNGTVSSARGAEPFTLTVA